MNISLRPLFNHVVIKRDKANLETKSGIVLPENSENKPSTGTVIYVGNGCLNADGSMRSLLVKPQDRIIFGKWSGTVLDDKMLNNLKINIENEENSEILIIKEEDILAIIN